MIDPATVKWLQVEATSKCNAWCPGCSRNKNGYELADGLVIEDLNNERFEDVLRMFPNLETVDFCGTFGDAVAAHNIKSLIDLAKQYSKKILIRTNGSLRDIVWWTQFANLLKGHSHEVWFCLDGLADTHSMYRQGTDFDKIIKNATTFISAGGTAVWQFIPWAHNEHQIKDCIKLSQELKFKRFELVRSVRSNFNARDYVTGDPYEIQPWSMDQKMNPLTFVKHRVDEENCMHLRLPSMYLNASGKLNVCCFFNQAHADNDIDKLMDIPTKLANQNLAPQVCKNHCGTTEQ